MEAFVRDVQSGLSVAEHLIVSFVVVVVVGVVQIDGKSRANVRACQHIDTGVLEKGGVREEESFFLYGDFHLRNKL
jgi:hypothetical protein